MSTSRSPWRTAVATGEVLLCATAVILDWFIPTLVILMIAAGSLAIRRQRPDALGFRRPTHPWRLAGTVLALAVAWTLVQVGLTMPILNRLTGQRQDLSAFADLQGNLPKLLLLLALTWTLAAVGEETAYRGFLEHRTRDAVGGSTGGVVGAIAVSATLFALAHTEQGLIGVALTFLDAIFFSVLNRRYRTLWASVLAHGFTNTIGLTAFFVVGPIYGLW